MRTTLTIDDQTAEALKKVAFDSGKSFKAVVNETLSAGLKNRRRVGSPRKPFKLSVARLGGARPGIDLMKSLQLVAVLEDDAIAEKLNQRK